MKNALLLFSIFSGSVNISIQVLTQYGTPITTQSGTQITTHGA